jgi:hypothetical protein
MAGDKGCGAVGGIVVGGAVVGGGGMVQSTTGEAATGGWHRVGVRSAVWGGLWVLRSGLLKRQVR